jgi:hypothetical protein
VLRSRVPHLAHKPPLWAAGYAASLMFCDDLVKRFKPAVGEGDGLFIDWERLDRLVAALRPGQVGAVLCLDASRLARNGRDWHISWNCADWLMPVSSTSMACTTPACRMTACCLA